ncbi:MAG: glycosyltransferase [Candidatus Marinimicrobia bacterium]|nr:glycosyltransferase [Candidatus Neomarinimicrobiota bacterium]
MNLLLLIFQGCLTVYLLSLLWCLWGLFRSAPGRSDEHPPVTVIVAARNGEPCLPRLWRQLQAQDYPATGLEIIIADDGLSQPMKAKLQAVAARDSRLKVVPSSEGNERLTHKKRALDAAIKDSRGEILLFTDADCQVGPSWVSSMVSYFTPDVDFVIGWSQTLAPPGMNPEDHPEEAENTLTVFEQLDFMMLMLAARGATLMGTPWASSGQNQAYRRSTYDRAGGFLDLANRLQGDDALFLQVARRKAQARVTFATDPASQVATEPSESLRHFLFQRIRWAGDAVAMWRWNMGFFPIALATFGANALMIILALAALANADVILPVLLPGLLLKATLEGIFLAVGLSRVERHGLGRHFPLWFLLQMPYITVVGLAGLWGNRLTWRHRSPSQEQKSTINLS